MSPDELREAVRRIRAERRIIRDKPATKVAKRIKSSKAKDELLKLLEEMSPEMREKMLGVLDAGSQKINTPRPDQGQGEV
jgi:hypothetical protein